MNANQHPQFHQESDRLDKTLKHVHLTIDAVDRFTERSKDNLRDAMSEIDTQEASSSYIDAMISTQFIEIANRNYDSLMRAKDKPYFARIDFIQSGKESIESFYIGKTSILKDGDFTPLVVDWRAPIASLYYEGRIGDNHYESEGDTYSGELTLKRQFAIEKGVLGDITDVDITTNDAFLQASLEANADKRLKDIASTIQAEQNKIIRASMRKPLIVQGVAGSGKTTIALHRIAYFIYTYEKTFRPDSFMIIAPNRLFINYISEVLPELGVENVNQTTYQDLMFSILGKKLKLHAKHTVLVNLINHSDNAEIEAEVAKIKGSIEFVKALEAYLTLYEKDITPTVHCDFFDERVASRVEVRSWFLSHFAHLPYSQRIKEIQKLLENRLKSIYKERLKQLQENYDAKIDHILRKEAPSDERREKVVSLMMKRDLLLEETKQLNKSLIRDYMRLFKKSDPFLLYSDFLKSIDNYLENVPRLKSGLTKNDTFDLEDVSPLTLIGYRCHGSVADIDISTVVVDEAQDFSSAEFYVLKMVLKTSRMTLLGDLSQGILAYRGTQNWQKMMHDVFPEDEPNYMTLVQSYRTTVEIMTEASLVLNRLNQEDLVTAKPVIRHGEAPIKCHFHSEKELIKASILKIEEWQAKKFKSMAIIAKTQNECLHIQHELAKSSIKTEILTDQSLIYNAGVVIVPSYLAKGLEFDAVLVVSLSQSYTDSERDIKLLYVAMTRALHQLDLYYIKGNIQAFE
ncbi:MAG: hypothetical protein BGO41_13220 [Clostridiales bacterium 38-18]|nr:MAG: hypothetical protein BGO41_13220 [Clostridiales bacterium 38-18]